MLVIGVTDLYNRWGFVDLDKDLGRFCRLLFKMTYGIKLQAPSNGEHITIFDPEDKANLKYCMFKGIKVSANLDLTKIYTNGNAIWFDVVSADIDMIRKHYCLGEKHLGLHYCFGYLEN